ncbi:MAG: aldo/keto reductase, partial [Dehalococcoidia bacterium]|nr:aldo/keto reductase [Dehalococcoidia bacterium]
MDYKPFGRTGVNVSPLVLGCMMFGQKTELDETKRIVDCALDAGINFLDTANVYGAGRSEEFTGEALSRDGKRDRVFLATKVHQRMSPD